MPASIKFPSSAYASGCSAPPLNMHATPRDWRRQTARSSTRKPRTASSINCANCSASMKWAAPCASEPGPADWSLGPSHKAYGKTEISERHRHRYEFNREYEKTLVAAGLRITGRTPDENYVEIVEAANHPWFLGCQFHPEFKSKPLEPHPLFAAFIGAS